ncbi:MAG TPA: hypothetical protein VG406_17690 [Isosphaeraceae bacterium]|jgi:hypothetical protein|nr:hypothetical protein [Isosphaeraceae bacterium]
MSGKSLGRFVGIVLAAGLAARAEAADPPGVAVPSTPRPAIAGGVPGSTPPGASVLSSAPAPAGVRPVKVDVVQALQRRAHPPASTPVPPTLEIEVLDPNVDPTGKPAVIPVVGPDGQARVEIPPTVLVHRYYYTGDRSFQAPLLPGGPTVVVINHPADGERLYLELQLPPGAPRVFYTRHSVEYNYGVQSVTLRFGAHGRPRILYRQGLSVADRARITTERVTTSTARLVQRMGITAAGRAVARETRLVVGNAADRVHDVGKMVITPVVQVVRLVPGAQLLTSPPDRAVQGARDNLVQQAQAQANQLDESIPTVR